MLLIIHLMLSRIQIPGRGNLLLFHGYCSKGEVFRGKGWAVPVFLLFYKAGLSVPAAML
jgi:hypothetical protein